MIASARRVVVKVGSSLLIDALTGQADDAFLAALAADIARLRGRGQQVVVVSSGAVALGRRRLGLTRANLDLEQKQAAAAAGQSLLMRAWEQALEPHAIPVAQVLLTRDDTEVRRRWLNARATIEALLRLGAAPVANENDTVATEELRYGDNDRLAARIAQMVQADLLVLLSDVDGLYTADPRRDPSARRLERVTEITPEIEAMAGGANAAAGVGSGGMATKVAAARIARGAGCATVIALGRPPDGAGPLSALEAGAPHTLFEASATPAAAYKAWIAGSLAPQGALTLDDGAVAALRSGKSLLPAGVRTVEGGFDKGDAVVVRDEAGREVARGLAAYDAAAARALAGRRSGEIEAVLGYPGPSALIHRDHLVWTGAGAVAGAVHVIGLLAALALAAVRAPSCASPPHGVAETAARDWAGSVNASWSEAFAEDQLTYRPPRLLFLCTPRGHPARGSGYAGRLGVVLDTDDLKTLVEVFGDDAGPMVALLVAHEISHHVQRQRADDAGARLAAAGPERELQADCYAGWSLARAGQNRPDLASAAPWRDDEALRRILSRALQVLNATRIGGLGRPDPAPASHGRLEDRLQAVRRGALTADPWTC